MTISRIAAFRAVALAFWIACVVFLALPTHGKASQRFQAPQLPQPRLVPAHGL